MSVRLTVPLIVLALLGSAAGAAQNDWKEFSSTEGRFRVLLPGKPEMQKQSVDTALGPQDLYMHRAVAGPLSYVVIYTDNPEAALKERGGDQFLDDVRDGFIRSIRGKLLTEKKATLDSNTGNELLVEAPNGINVVSRLCLVKNRLYQLIAIGPKEESAAPEVTWFFDSFKLVKP
ncbi:MAG TPA: hypothetical protein VK689_08030 [Armatimonadota bacterium]|nr:hypothetical protein [Armatimonadota bacterium]